MGRELRLFDGRRRNDRCRRIADERGMLGRARCATEMQAQVAMGEGVLGERLVVVQTVHDISRAREQQRQQREQRYDAVVAEPAKSVERYGGSSHETWGA